MVGMENDTPAPPRAFSLISKNVLWEVVGQLDTTLLLVHQIGPLATLAALYAASTAAGKEFPPIVVLVPTIARPQATAPLPLFEVTTTDPPG